jgi:hypothetical protein
LLGKGKQSASTLRLTWTQLIRLTDVKRPCDFFSDVNTSGGPETKSLDFFFDIPHAKPVANPYIHPTQTLPSSTHFQASKYIMSHTALSDREAIEGVCEVSYQVDARFLLQDSVVFQTYCPVNVISLPDPKVSAAAKMLATEHKSIAKPAMLYRPWRRGKGDLWINVLEPEPITWKPGAQPTCHPVNFFVKLSLTQSTKAILQPVQCSVQARWESVSRFSVIAQSNEASISNSSDPTLNMCKTTILKEQHAKLLFPPWYQIPADEGESTTTTTLTLVPPPLSAGSTFSTDLMSMSYIVDLVLSVNDPRGLGGSLSCGFRIPVSLSLSGARRTAAKEHPRYRHFVLRNATDDIDPPHYVR